MACTLLSIAMLDSKLRPQAWQDFIGQQQIKDVLRRALGAAEGRSEPLDHLLLTGPPGLGKTTLARLVGGQDLVRVTGQDYDDLEAGLTRELGSREPESVQFIFIDEVHALDIDSQERLANLMDRSARGTIIAATTRPAEVTAPLRTRFPLRLRLDFYPTEDLAEIVENSAAALGVTLEPGASEALAERARGTPRIANHLLRRVRDVTNQASASDIGEILSSLGIDFLGIRPEERKYLMVLGIMFGGGPAGASTLAGALAENARTIKEIYEPLLLRKALIEITGRGRKLTVLGLQYLKRAGHSNFGNHLERILG